MEMLGISEAARRLKVHPSTLKRWDGEGRVHPIRDSAGKRLFKDDEIERLVNERSTKKAGYKR